MQMQTAGSFAMPHDIRSTELFLIISWQPQSPFGIGRRLLSMDSQRTLQANAIRMNRTGHGKMYCPREAKGGFLNLQTCNRFLNCREQLNKWSCSLLENTETCVDSDCGNIEKKWCSLCGGRSGWMTCGKCEGEGGFSTRPGLGGVKDKVRAQGYLGVVYILINLACVSHPTEIAGICVQNLIHNTNYNIWPVTVGELYV